MEKSTTLFVVVGDEDLSPKIGIGDSPPPFNPFGPGGHAHGVRWESGRFRIYSQLRLMVGRQVKHRPETAAPATRQEVSYQWHPSTNVERRRLLRHCRKRAEWILCLIERTRVRLHRGIRWLKEEVPHPGIVNPPAIWREMTEEVNLGTK